MQNKPSQQIQLFMSGQSKTKDFVKYPN